MFPCRATAGGSSAACVCLARIAAVLEPSAHLNMLTAFVVLALTLAPIAAAAALRVRG
ncbi:MAG: hypothetical protein M3495_16745 [Pseudomonadota bacterium]|nr:hypothetical protein [Pseudomonadota bacterium]